MSDCTDKRPLPIITTVEGWMTERELRFLCEAAHNNHVLEIGTFLGRSTINMLRYAKRLVSIDHFKGNPYDIASDVVRKIESGGSTLWQQFLHRLAEYQIGKDTEFVLMKMDSARAHMLLGVQAFDFVFIDGGHEYEDVKRDILNFKGHVADGGILAGHDYYTNGNFPGVKKAVEEAFGEPNEVVDTIWIKRM